MLLIIHFVSLAREDLRFAVRRLQAQSAHNILRQDEELAVKSRLINYELRNHSKSANRRLEKRSERTG